MALYKLKIQYKFNLFSTNQNQLQYLHKQGSPENFKVFQLIANDNRDKTSKLQLLIENRVANQLSQKHLCCLDASSCNCEQLDATEQTADHVMSAPQGARGPKILDDEPHAGSIRSLLAFDLGDAETWGSKIINPRLQYCLGLTLNRHLFKQKRCGLRSSVSQHVTQCDKKKETNLRNCGFKLHQTCLSARVYVNGILS